MVSRGLKDPRKATQGIPNLDPAVDSYIRQCKKVDPPARPQQALPSSTVKWIASRFARAPLRHAKVASHLIVTAFFFLLRVGEYTPSTQPRQTIPLRKMDIKLWRNHKLLTNDAPLATLLTADAVTINLANQKNGRKNDTLHHSTSGLAGFDPVESMAYLLHEIKDLPPTTPIGTSRTGTSTEQVASSTIRTLIQLGAVGDNLPSRGYDLNRIGSHSLRSGGAVHLKILGYNHVTIQKLGRWSSDTYLRYIQSQIGELTMGIAKNMSKTLWYHIVSG